MGDYSVTTLNDSGAGSLRAALEIAGTRTITPALAGTIDLSSPIAAGGGSVVLDGTNAPQGGLCVKSYPVYFGSGLNGFTIKNMRFRRGDTVIAEANDDGDPFTLVGASNGKFTNCSFSFGIDETVQLQGCHDIVFENCIFSLALYNSVNYPEAGHSMGAMCNAGSYNITFYNCLFIHCGDRIPGIFDGYNINIINCISYNSLNSAPKFSIQNQGPPDPTGLYRANFIGNWNITGPSTNLSEGGVPRYALYFDPSGGAYHVYISGNRCDKRTTDAQPETDAVYPGYPATLVESVYSDILPSGITIRDADAAKTYVLANAGAMPRDSLDTQLIADVEGGTGAIIDSPDEVGGWPNLTA